MIRNTMFAVVLLVSTVTLAADWPTYLGDNGRTGFVSEKLDAPTGLAWVYDSPDRPELAWSGPREEPIEGKLMRHRVAFDQAIQVAVSGDNLYFGSSVDHQIYCLNHATGEIKWNFYTDAPIRLAPTVANGKIYVGSDDGNVYCLDAETGKLLWKVQAAPRNEMLLARGKIISRWPIRTGVTVDAGVAYFGAGIFPHETVYLIAVDAETGELLWRNDHISQENAGRNDLSPQGYLLASETKLFVPSGRSLPAAFDKSTGEQIFKKSYSWRSTAGGVVGGSKAVLADGQIFASGAAHFLAMDEERGSVGYAWITGRQLVVAGDKSYTVDGSKVVALDRKSHAAATAQRQTLNLKMNSLRSKKRSMDAEKYQTEYAALKKQIDKLTATGSLWEAETGCESALVACENVVVAGGENKVEMYDAASGEKIWGADVVGEAAGLAISGGRLFVSTDAGKIYCFAAGETDAKKVAAAKIKDPYGESEWSTVCKETAQKILEQSKQSRGYCLVAGAEEGCLAYHLAANSDLRVYGIEPDAKKVAEARKRLSAAGMYGSRVVILRGTTEDSPLSNYFANLVVSESLMQSGTLPGGVESVSRFVKPCGGKLCITTHEKAPAANKLTPDAIHKLAANAEFASDENVELFGLSAIATRGKLPGAGEWSHQYGNPANTMTSNDTRVSGGLRVLWYGDPGPAPMINRHEGASAPLSTNGKMFVQGVDSVKCYDAYNGLFLWEHANPGAIRTGVFNNEDTSNLASRDESMFVCVGAKCTELDAESGTVKNVFAIPPSEDKLERAWGYVSHADGVLYGTSTIRSELAASLRRRGLKIKSDTDAIFAIDLKTGKPLFTHRGDNILHVTITIGDGKMFFIDSSISSEEREALLRQDKTELKNLPPEEAKKKEAELKALDVRKVVAIDAKTGELLWSQAVDVTDCSRVGIGGGNLTLMYKDGHLLVCGANANGHYWRQFLSGQFNERRLVMLDAESGEKIWSKDANYRHRPIIVGNQVFAEPWAFDLKTGVEKTRIHPLTGVDTKWQFSRPGHHCGPITATPDMLFFRSGFTGYYDLEADAGVSHFAGHRTGCWVNVIPGNGLVMIPEASAGCVCQFSIAATVVLEPAPQDTWRIFSATGASLPVKRLAVNLGAPGDRRDENGKLWLSYPRPSTVGRLEYVFDIGARLSSDGSWYNLNEETQSIAGAETAWVYTSGARGFRECTIPLLGKDDKPAKYLVKLHFAELDDAEPGERVFDIKLQDKVVEANFDPAEAAGGAARAVSVTFDEIPVSGNLKLELIPNEGSQSATLSGIEVQMLSE